VALPAGFRLRRPVRPRDRPSPSGRLSAQTLKLIGELLMLLELFFDVLDACLDLLGNRADVRDLRHVTPGSVGLHRDDLTLTSGDGASPQTVVSNQATTRRLVHGLERLGIPAFGPIWDS
jgi:hypothetical protein